jgi:hypothetical protein
MRCPPPLKSTVPTIIKSTVPTIIQSTIPTIIPQTSIAPKSTIIQPTITQSTGSISNWIPLMGTINDWSLSSTNTLNHITSSLSALTLSGTTASINDGTDVFIVSNINPGTSRKYGLAINAKSGSSGLQFHGFNYDNGVYKICYAYANRPTYDCCGIYNTIPPHGIFKMRHTIVGTKHYYRGYIGDVALSTYILDNTWGGGNQGIIASGNANFKSFYVRTPVSVKITFSSCAMSYTDIINMVSSQLGISSSLIANVQKLGCTKKRDVQAETISVLIVGSESSTALELANQLKVNPSSEMSSVTIEDSSISDVVAESGSAISLSAAPLSTGLTGLGIAAIACIVAGSVVGAVGIGVGIYFANKSKTKVLAIQENQNQNQNQEVHLPKVKGVDIFNLDPYNHQSLTVRNPNIVNGHNFVS